jgi:hypothetical protein
MHSAIVSGIMEARRNMTKSDPAEKTPGSRNGQEITIHARKCWIVVLLTSPPVQRVHAHSLASFSKVAINFIRATHGLRNSTKMSHDFVHIVVWLSVAVAPNIKNRENFANSPPTEAKFCKRASLHWGFENFDSNAVFLQLLSQGPVKFLQNRYLHEQESAEWTFLFN